jgi:hypothetical protein
MAKKSYIDDNCIIKDETFLGIKSSIICDICKKILKDPVMCSNCQKVFCKACIDEKGECTTIGCLGNRLDKCADKCVMLGLIKYCCKNCKEVVKYNDVEKHLKSGCKFRENEPTLADCINKKHELKKLTKEEVKNAKKNNEEIYHLSSK